MGPDMTQLLTISTVAVIVGMTLLACQSAQGSYGDDAAITKAAIIDPAELDEPVSSGDPTTTLEPSPNVPAGKVKVPAPIEGMTLARYSTERSTRGRCRRSRATPDNGPLGNLSPNPPKE